MLIGAVYALVSVLANVRLPNSAKSPEDLGYTQSLFLSQYGSCSPSTFFFSPPSSYIMIFRSHTKSAIVWDKKEKYP